MAVREDIKPGASPREIGQMFSRIATRYDLHNRLFSLGLDQGWRKKLVQGLDARPEGHILDLGAGTLDVTLSLRERFPSARIYSADISLAMLKHGLAAHFSQPEDSVRSALRNPPLVLAADAFHLPFADNSLDAITIAFGLRNMNPRTQALQELFRVIRPGGGLHVLELAPVNIPVMGGLVHLYESKIMPYLADISNKSGEAYRYLAASIEKFPSPSRFESELLLSGFATVSRRRCFLGVAAIHRAYKGQYA